MTKSACYRGLSGCCVKNGLNGDGKEGKLEALRSTRRKWLYERWSWPKPKQGQPGPGKVGGFQRCLQGRINRAL